ncbi:MAG: acetyl-CoA carboxylase biotin carboxyl carrier protein [Deltaproteobacteria bacterium]|nr:acetyl-CoA carboxylase biotin carboxyl carrier protein [Deltaproteobacteria bacterium]
MRMLKESDVTEFEFEREGEVLKIKREAGGVTTVGSGRGVQFLGASEGFASPVVSRNAIQGELEQRALTQGGAAEETVGKHHWHQVLSPMVGTFYDKPSPDAKAYVAVGDSVSKGDVLCIVEAMKLMNEIEADVSGKIVEICVKDTQMVEYGEVLFQIEPA